VDWNAITIFQDLSDDFIIKEKNYICFDALRKKRITSKIINNCYDHIPKKKLPYNSLKHKDILPEVKLYYEVN